MSQALLPVAILAGGLGQRLGPLTARLPKPLVDVNGEPFIVHQLRLLRANGAQRVVVCIGFRGEAIQDVIGDGSRYGLDVCYSCDGANLLGTGGAIKNALPLLGPSFLVLYGDSYLPCNYRQVQTFFEHSDKLALMTVFRNNGQWDRSNVEFRDGIIYAYDKRMLNPRMRHIDYGLGAFRAEAFDDIQPNEPCDLAAIYQTLLARKQLDPFEVEQRFYEIGSLAGLEETRAHLASRDVGVDPARPATNASGELELLRQAVDDQARLLDALRDRAEAASRRETEARSMLLEAHEQILQRDKLIAELRGIGSGPREISLLEERTQWAQRATAEVAQRDEVIRRLQAALEEQTAWAQRSAAEVAHRDAIIHNLQVSARVSGTIVARLTLLQRVLPGKLRSLMRERLRI